MQDVCNHGNDQKKLWSLGVRPEITDNDCESEDWSAERRWSTGRPMISHFPAHVWINSVHQCTNESESNSLAGCEGLTKHTQWLSVAHSRAVTSDRCTTEAAHSGALTTCTLSTIWLQLKTWKKFFFSLSLSLCLVCFAVPNSNLSNFLGRKSFNTAAAALNCPNDPCKPTLNTMIWGWLGVTRHQHAMFCTEVRGGPRSPLPSHTYTCLTL